jgi:hypothetical protein
MDDSLMSELSIEQVYALVDAISDMEMFIVEHVPDSQMRERLPGYSDLISWYDKVLYPVYEELEGDSE